MDFKDGEYRGFIIKRGIDSVQDNSNTIETNDAFDIVVKSIPFQLVPDLKELAKTEWFDQNGDDEFVPKNPVYKSQELTITFYCISANGTANEKIHAFWQFLQGEELIFYDRYTKIGRSKVRYVSFVPQAFKRREGENDIVEFQMKFKINDPVTNAFLNWPIIIPVSE